MIPLLAKASCGSTPPRGRLTIDYHSSLRSTKLDKSVGYLVVQESLANAKVSTRQRCVYEIPYRRNLRQINARNTMLTSTFSGLQCCRYLHSFSCWKFCEIPRKSPENSNSSRPSKVISLVVQRKLICNFLLVINSNSMDVSPTVFEILTHLARK